MLQAETGLNFEVEMQYKAATTTGPICRDREQKWALGEFKVNKEQ